MPLYKSLTMDWAVASEQNYRKIRMGLALNSNRRVVAADADELPMSLASFDSTFP